MLIFKLITKVATILRAKKNLSGYLIWASHFTKLLSEVSWVDREDGEESILIGVAQLWEVSLSKTIFLQGYLNALILILIHIFAVKYRFWNRQKF